MNAQQLKYNAAKAAIEFVKPGMKLGIGTGSTADEFTKLLAVEVKNGLNIQAVTTSENTEQLCKASGINTNTLDELPALDLTIDGADELDDELQLIKGGGGALLREKIVAKASKEMIVIADLSKHVSDLGQFPLPIEVNAFGLKATTNAINNLIVEMELSATLIVRKKQDGKPFITDGGHYIIDASFGLISDAKRLNHLLNQIPGVVENGLFIDIASKAIISGPDGIKILQKK